MEQTAQPNHEDFWSTLGQPPVQVFLHSEDIAELIKALVEFQTTQKVIEFDQENAYQKYKYATLTALVEGTKEARKKAKLAVTQLLNSNSVTTVLLHESGQWISSNYIVTPSNMKGMSRAQEMGAAVTYARRYAYAAILGLVSDQDIDGMDGSDPTAETKGRPSGVKKENKPLDPAIDKLLNGANSNEELAVIWDSFTPEEQNDPVIIAAFKVRSIGINKSQKTDGKSTEQGQAGK